MRRRLRLLAAAGLAAAAVCGPARAIEIQKVVSARGVVAWFVPDRSVPLVTLGFAFRRAGWSADPAGRNGTAEMVSGLLDEGAGGMDAQAFQKAVEDIAARLSFSAGRDEFRGRLQTLSAERGRAFELLRLALSEPRFDGDAVSRVRRQTLALLSRRAEDPERIAGRTWNETLFPGHAYGRPGSGTAETVAAITAGDLRGFVESRFGRDRLVIGAVGDIGADELAERLDQVFGGLPRRASSSPRIARIRPAAAGRVVVVRKEIPQSVIRFGHEGIARGDPDWYAAALAVHALGGGQSSRLFREVRGKRGLAYSVASWLDPMDGAAVLAGWVATRNARAAESLALVRSEWRRIAEHGITETELRDAKSHVNGSFPLRLASGRGIARALVGVQLSRLGISYLGRRARLFDRVTLADANRVARRLFRERDLTVVIVGDPAGIRETPRP